MKSSESERLRRALVVDRPETDEQFKAHQFLFNIADARENGYDTACVECGTGTPDDPDDDEFAHEDWCELRERNEELEGAFRERLKGIVGKADQAS